MLWVDELTDPIKGPQIVNDSKTPSGPVHVGSLRGVLIHDAVYRVLRSRGQPTRYLYGIDNYDPLDELPASNGERFRRFLGMPLCNIPAPEESPAANLGEHYISEFLDVLRELGVAPDIYRMSDIYRSNRFDAAIDVILHNSAAVRAIDRAVAGAKRDDDWFPFQVICERCGRIGTTKVSAYDGDQVSYACLPNLVKWAEGCSHRGKISPFGGAGKLSWKLEWVAKWATFDITIEGAGKDHNTRGGSRDVAVRCLREIFRKNPPVNIPYEFFLVRGAKMSSSRGVGVSAREMADLLPPELLRYLMIRTTPRKPVDFFPGYEKIVRLYNDFDRLREAVNGTTQDHIKSSLYAMAEAESEPGYYAPPFDLLLSLLQMPHLDVREHCARLKGGQLSPLDEQHLQRRIRSARHWLDNFAGAGDRLELQRALPAQALSLSGAQREFLHRLAERLTSAAWDASKLQACIFDVARQTPISHEKAFTAVYTVLFARDSGPRAGNILSFLEREFVIQRMTEPPRPDCIEFWLDTSMPEEDLRSWLIDMADDIVDVCARALFDGSAEHPTPTCAPYIRSFGFVEVTVTLKDGEQHTRRCTSAACEGYGSSLEIERECATEYSGGYVEDLESQLSREIPLTK